VVFNDYCCPDFTVLRTLILRARAAAMSNAAAKRRSEREKSGPVEALAA
jgi:hypothetical protein